MTYTPHTEAQRQEMLRAIGVEKVADLFADVPAAHRFPTLQLPAPISEIEIPPEGRVVHLRQYGFIKVFKIVHSDGDVEYWATDVLDASESGRKSFRDCGWNIEEYHRGI